jgi:hypothetical protein
MPNTKKKATSLQVNDAAASSHETAVPSTLFDTETLTAKAAFQVLTKFGNEPIGFSLLGESIAEMKDLTVQSIFHYTALMSGETFSNKNLYPLQIMYDLLSRIEKLMLTQNPKK